MTAAEVTGSNGSNGPHSSDRDLRIDERTGAVLADHAAWNEEHRRLAEGALAALRDSGALRLLVPERAGGDEREFADMVANVREAALYDGAAAWVLMVLVGHSWMLGSMTEELQDEVYGADPDTVVPGSLAPVGSATECDGGWLIDGRWPFTSGAIWGEWFLLGSQVLAPGERPRLLHVVIPREDIAIDDNWYAIGLRGTGSCDVVAEQAFVPTHRMIDSGDLLGGRSPWSRRHRTSVYRTPILPGLSVHVAAATLGLARAGLDDAAERFGVQDDRYMGSSKSKRPGLHMRLAEANTEVRSAELLIDDTLGLLRQAAEGADSKKLRAQAKYQGSYAIELCRRALDRVTTAAGGRAVFDGSRLQQAFRDATMASQHQVADLDTVGEAYGRTRLGMDPGPHPL